MKIAEILEEKMAFENFDDIFEYLLNASPITSMIGSPLYRGMSYVENHDKIISSGARGDSDDHGVNDPVYGKYYDQWMTEKFGYPYLSRGIFTTGDPDMASDYGDVFMIVPVGKFEYVWSSYVSDQINIHETILGDHPDGEYSYEEFCKYMENCHYTNQNLQQAVDSGQEIILRCDKYIHLSLQTVKEWGGDYDSLEELWNDLKG